MDYSLVKASPIEVYILDEREKIVARAFHYMRRGWEIYNLKYRYLGHSRWKRGILKVYGGCTGKFADLQAAHAPPICAQCPFQGFGPPFSLS